MDETIKWISEFELAAIRGCIINGATEEEIYTAFEGIYSLVIIRSVILEFMIQRKFGQCNYIKTKISCQLLKLKKPKS